MDRISLDWPTTITDSYNLAYKIFNGVGRPDLLVFLGRGALFPASIISNVLGIKDVYNLGMRSYDNETQGKIKIIQELGDNFCTVAEKKHILVVDELSDTGNTLYMAKNNIDKCNPIKTTYATLYVKLNTTFTPDFFIKSFDEKIWLDFPWEFDIIK